MSSRVPPPLKTDPLQNSFLYVCSDMKVGSQITTVQIHLKQNSIYLGRGYMPKTATARLVDLGGVILFAVTNFYMRTSQENVA